MKFFRENLSLKLASLALAIGVWAYVRGEDRPVQIFSVPLDLRNLPPNLMLAGGVDETVSVRVRAPESTLRTMGNETLLATVDLGGLGPGEQTVRVGPESVRVPSGVEVIRVSPEFLSLRLEKKVRTDLPVTARVVGNPAPGYVLGSVRVLPARAMVEGPEGAVAEAVEVDTETIRIDGRSQSFEAMVDLYPARPDVKVLGDGKAQVLLQIHERYVTRTFEGVKVRAEGSGPKVRLDPETAEVTLEGAPGDLDGLAPQDLSVVVDLAAIPSGQRRAMLEPRVVFADPDTGSRLIIRAVTPETISLKVLQDS